MLVGSIESCSASYFSEVSSSLLTSNEILLGPQVKLSTMPRLPATICMNGRILMLSDLQSFCEFASEPRLEEGRRLPQQRTTLRPTERSVRERGA